MIAPLIGTDKHFTVNDIYLDKIYSELHRLRTIDIITNILIVAFSFCILIYGSYIINKAIKREVNAFLLNKK